MRVIANIYLSNRYIRFVLWRLHSGGAVWLRQIKPSFIDSTPLAELAALTAIVWLQVFVEDGGPVLWIPAVLCSNCRNSCLDTSTKRGWIARLLTESVGKTPLG